jgi:hypothetical protein
MNFINRCMIHSIDEFYKPLYDSQYRWHITVPTRWRKFSNKTVDRLTTAEKRGRFVHRTNFQTSSRHSQTVYVLGTEYALGEFQNLSLADMVVKKWNSAMQWSSTATIINIYKTTFHIYRNLKMSWYNHTNVTFEQKTFVEFFTWGNVHHSIPPPDNMWGSDRS